MRDDHAVLVYVDGGSRGNGTVNQSGYGSFLIDGELEAHRFELGSCTNNVAEYQSLLVALRYCIERRYGSLEIRMDSALVVNQVMGGWQCRQLHLQVLLREVQDLLTQIPNVRLVQVEREEIMMFLGH